MLSIKMISSIDLPYKTIPGGINQPKLQLIRLEITAVEQTKVARVGHENYSRVPLY